MERTKSGAERLTEGVKFVVTRGEGCGAVQIFDLANSTHAKLAQEATPQEEADWQQATEGVAKRAIVSP